MVLDTQHVALEPKLSKTMVSDIFLALLWFCLVCLVQMTNLWSPFDFQTEVHEF